VNWEAEFMLEKIVVLTGVEASMELHQMGNGFDLTQRAFD